jgi:glycogen operon protein
MSDGAQRVVLPALADRRWHRAVDTALPFPQDLLAPRDQVPIAPEQHYDVRARSVVVLEAR